MNRHSARPWLAALTLLAALPAPAVEVDTRRFAAEHEIRIEVPEGVGTLRLWMVVPQSVPEQDVEKLVVEVPGAHRFTTDSAGNRLLFTEIEAPAAGELRVATRFVLRRREARSGASPECTRPYAGGEREALAAHLEPDTHVVIDDRVRELADRIAGEEDNPVAEAKALYDWMLDNVDYWVKEPALKKASKVGSTSWCLDTGTGNCTDFHSLYASLARARGIPTRIVYGSLFKPELEGEDVDQSYHCWIDFWAPELGWVPLDVAVADIYAGAFPLTDANRTLVSRTTATGYAGPDPALVEYYFGNLDARRVTWSVGRDLELEPRQSGGPVNALPKARVEVDGVELEEGVGWTRKLTYRELREGD